MRKLAFLIVLGLFLSANVSTASPINDFNSFISGLFTPTGMVVEGCGGVCYDAYDNQFYCSEKQTCEYDYYSGYYCWDNPECSSNPSTSLQCTPGFTCYDDPQGAYRYYQPADCTPAYFYEWCPDGCADSVSCASSVPQSATTTISDYDTTPPSVIVSTSPSGSSAVTLTATASDASGISSVYIYADEGSGYSAKQTCYSSPCSAYLGPYSSQTTVSYYVLAYDSAGNSGYSDTGSFTVTPSSQLPLSSTTTIESSCGWTCDPLYPDWRYNSCDYSWEECPAGTACSNGQCASAAPAPQSSTTTIGAATSTTTISATPKTTTTSPSTDACSSYPSCSSCVAVNPCGWSASGNMCKSGTASGSNDASSSGDDWAWTSSSCPAQTAPAPQSSTTTTVSATTTTTSPSPTSDSCSSYSSCSLCTAASSCGWDKTLSNTNPAKCKTGTPSGASDGTASGDNWVWAASSCPAQTTPAPAPATTTTIPPTQKTTTTISSALKTTTTIASSAKECGAECPKGSFDFCPADNICKYEDKVYSCVYDAGCNKAIESKPLSILITSPEAGSIKRKDFVITVRDENAAECSYSVISFPPNADMVDSSLFITKDWTKRTCNSNIEITVGSDKDCRIDGERTCQVMVKAADKDGKEASDYRSFSISQYKKFEGEFIDRMKTTYGLDVEIGERLVGWIEIGDESGIRRYVDTSSDKPIGTGLTQEEVETIEKGLGLAPYCPRLYKQLVVTKAFYGNIELAEKYRVKGGSSSGASYSYIWLDIPKGIDLDKFAEGPKSLEGKELEKLNELKKDNKYIRSNREHIILGLIHECGHIIHNTIFDLATGKPPEFGGPRTPETSSPVHKVFSKLTGWKIEGSSYKKVGEHPVIKDSYFTHNINEFFPEVFAIYKIRPELLARKEIEFFRKLDEGLLKDGIEYLKTIANNPETLEEKSIKDEKPTIEIKSDMEKAAVKEEITLTVIANDGKGLKSLERKTGDNKIWFLKVGEKWESFDCGSQKTCSKTWKVSEEKGGTYSYCFRATGSDNRQSEKCIDVEVAASEKASSDKEIAESCAFSCLVEEDCMRMQGSNVKGVCPKKAVRGYAESSQICCNAGDTGKNDYAIAWVDQLSDIFGMEVMMLDPNVNPLAVMSAMDYLNPLLTFMKIKSGTDIGSLETDLLVLQKIKEDMETGKPLDSILNTYRRFLDKKGKLNKDGNEYLDKKYAQFDITDIEKACEERFPLITSVEAGDVAYQQCLKTKNTRNFVTALRNQEKKLIESIDNPITQTLAILDIRSRHPDVFSDAEIKEYEAELFYGLAERFESGRNREKAGEFYGIIYQNYPGYSNYQIAKTKLDKQSDRGEWAKFYAAEIGIAFLALDNYLVPFPPTPGKAAALKFFYRFPAIKKLIAKVGEGKVADALVKAGWENNKAWKFAALTKKRALSDAEKTEFGQLLKEAVISPAQLKVQRGITVEKGMARIIAKDGKESVVQLTEEEAQLLLSNNPLKARFASVLTESSIISSSENLRLAARDMLLSEVPEKSAIEVLEKGAAASAQAIEDVYVKYIRQYSLSGRSFSGLSRFELGRTVAQTAERLASSYDRFTPEQINYLVQNMDFEHFVRLLNAHDADLLVFKRIGGGVNGIHTDEVDYIVPIYARLRWAELAGDKAAGKLATAGEQEMTELAEAHPLLPKLIQRPREDIFKMYKTVDSRALKGEAERISRKHLRDTDFPLRITKMASDPAAVKSLLTGRTWQYVDNYVRAGLLSPESSQQFGAELTRLVEDLADVAVKSREAALKQVSLESQLSDIDVGFAFKADSIDTIAEKVAASVSYLEHVANGQKFSSHSYQHLQEDLSKSLAAISGQSSFTKNDEIYLRLVAFMHDIGYADPSIVQRPVDFLATNAHPEKSFEYAYMGILHDLQTVLAEKSALITERTLQEDMDRTIGKEGTAVVLDAIRRHSGPNGIQYSLKNLNDPSTRVAALFALSDGLAVVKTPVLFQKYPKVSSMMLQFFAEGKRLEIAEASKLFVDKLKQARKLMESDPVAAEKLFAELTDMDSGNTLLGRFRQRFRQKMHAALDESRLPEDSDAVLQQYHRAIDATAEYDFAFEVAPVIIEQTSIKLSTRPGGIGADVTMQVSEPLYRKLLAVVLNEMARTKPLDDARKEAQEEVAAQVTKILKDLIKRSADSPPADKEIENMAASIYKEFVRSRGDYTTEFNGLRLTMKFDKRQSRAGILQSVTAEYRGSLINIAPTPEEIGTYKRLALKQGSGKPMAPDEIAQLAKLEEQYPDIIKYRPVAGAVTPVAKTSSKAKSLLEIVFEKKREITEDMMEDVFVISDSEAARFADDVRFAMSKKALGKVEDADALFREKYGMSYTSYAADYARNGDELNRETMELFLGRYKSLVIWAKRDRLLPDNFRYFDMPAGSALVPADKIERYTELLYKLYFPREKGALKEAELSEMEALAKQHPRVKDWLVGEYGARIRAADLTEKAVFKDGVPPEEQNVFMALMDDEMWWNEVLAKSGMKQARGVYTLDKYVVEMQPGNFKVTLTSKTGEIKTAIEPFHPKEAAYLRLKSRQLSADITAAGKDELDLLLAENPSLQRFDSYLERKAVVTEGEAAASAEAIASKSSLAILTSLKQRVVLVIANPLDDIARVEAKVTAREKARAAGSAKPAEKAEKTDVLNALEAANAEGGIKDTKKLAELEWQVTESSAWPLRLYLPKGQGIEELRRRIEMYVEGMAEILGAEENDVAQLTIIAGIPSDELTVSSGFVRPSTMFIAEDSLDILPYELAHWMTHWQNKQLIISEGIASWAALKLNPSSAGNYRTVLKLFSEANTPLISRATPLEATYPTRSYGWAGGHLFDRIEEVYGTKKVAEVWKAAKSLPEDASIRYILGKAGLDYGTVEKDWAASAPRATI